MKHRTPFLLEIGSEEIPARFFDIILPLLEKNTADIFSKNRIAFSSVKCLATPRRLTVTADIIDPLQKSAVSEIIGPPAKVSFDQNDKPTKAAEGFARSQGIAVTDLRTINTEKGSYIAVVKEERGDKVSKVLPVVVPEIIHSLHFPKSMRWGYHSIRFARPIRWILCLYGSSVVNFSIDGIKSGSYTWGHRLLSNKKVKIGNPGEYEKTLRNHSVIVNHEKRHEMISNGIEKAAKRSGGVFVKDDDLLKIVNFLVEYPHAVLCSFSDDYLTLPDELLITVMKDHQKYFALTDRNGELINSFVVISNTNSKIASTVRAGAEKVIKARFEDARFYYKDDVKVTLHERREILRQITFHDKIGTVYEKVERLTAIADELCNRIDPSLKNSTTTAAELSKSDLTTGVVREFPELQGITGYYYALNEKLQKKVAVAIKEHYKPLHASDSIPSNEEGKFISLADKIDSIASFYSVGIIPTGSEDPFALRRQAQGIVQILLQSEYPVTVNELMQLAARYVHFTEDTSLGLMKSFFVQRIEFALSVLGYSDDVVRSVLQDSLDMPLHILKKKAVDISSFKKLSGYSDFILAIKRVHNIIPELQLEAVDKELFVTSEESELHHRIETLSGDMSRSVGFYDFTSAFKSLLPIKEPVNTFFDNVLVMDKDETIRNNRLSLLKKVWDTTLTICDFSKLTDQ